DLPVAHLSSEGIDRPSIPRRHDVEMAVEVDEGAFSLARPRPHDVEARMPRGVLGPALGGEVLHRETAALQPIADDARTFRVTLARRVHGGQPPQLRCE